MVSFGETTLALVAPLVPGLEDMCEIGSYKTDTARSSFNDLFLFARRLKS